MNKYLRIGLAAAITALVFLLLALVSARSDMQRAALSCSGLKVDILDSARIRFVSEADVKRYMDESYGTYIGKRLDSVDLKRIETILRSKSTILGGEAYMTDDGILHVEVTQREPVVRFKTPSGGFYADADGFIFPLHPDYSPDVPVVEGPVPLAASDGFKGEVSARDGQDWLTGLLDVIRYIREDRFWSGAIGKINSEKGGSLVLTPVSGAEKFIFGRPEDIREKFARMEDYYRYIAPAHDSLYYKTVDVRYKGRTVCRR